MGAHFLGPTLLAYVHSCSRYSGEGLLNFKALEKKTIKAQGHMPYIFRQ